MTQKPELFTAFALQTGALLLRNMILENKRGSERYENLVKCKCVKWYMN